MRGGIGVTAAVLVLALAAAALAASSKGRQGGDGSVAVAASGNLRIADSRGERAILSAPALAPGHPVAGTVTIRNLGAAAGLALSRHRLTEAPGAGGRLLGDALRLTIHRISDPPGLVYHGPLAAMRPLHLGLLAPGAARSYRFVASLPRPRRASGALMGARVRFDYRWRLTPKR
ncbi:MAG TPA: hypothetical protein VFJ61_01155 [Solirubrobacterales bacterium]|nr:hypothetical protein [Solirubrobacterales bacterium]